MQQFARCSHLLAPPVRCPRAADRAHTVQKGAEYFSLGAGADLAPLLVGLENDLCHAEHWGYLISGVVVVTYLDGSSERCSGGDVFHWPAWHTVRVEAEAEIVLFSPQHSHVPVMDHIKAKMGLATA